MRSLYDHPVEMSAIWFFKDDAIAPAIEAEVKAALYSRACLPSTEVFLTTYPDIIRKVGSIIDRDALDFVRIL